MEPYLAQIIMFAGNFAPRGWAFCQGQILAITQNTALFSLIGTTYGGNGQTTFGLPDLRGRAPIGVGQGPGLPNINWGGQGGAPTHTLISTEMPAHNHSLNASSQAGNTAAPANAFLAATGSLDPEYRSTLDSAVPLGTNSMSVVGGSQPHNNMQPYLGMNFIICTTGIYPSRN
ncbi:phage tail protein [Rudanella paleaurantiibacter]|uniref:Phage tail protein n=1 Tax=Rudanella paleaurantiibacter TaxID=2614655 RepID=A0A7J5U0V3_9BACT|nr:tail fiber protein [Rudanella paleaurantiibacter]KAB7731171.1 phage tail protein [Rudanella paleaurantiibacter]